MSMKKKDMMLFILAAAVIFAAGCGYSIHRKADLPFTEISIGKIENRTFEPKLQDKLRRALVEEFAKNGITVTPAAKTQLSGVIHEFKMVSLSERDDITVEYSVKMETDFTFRDSAGKVREIGRKGKGLQFIISFGGSGALADTLAARDAAEQRAMADIALQVVGTLIYP
jgi:outer membrane lipopolysaccharide assembly protein LptE/RlpB